jgi:hypothetical protein
MATPDERKILEVIEEKGGESHESAITKAMGRRLDSVRTILTSMGSRDYVNVFLSGKVEIADKGWSVLGRTPSLPYAMDSIPNETPEERFKRYMSKEAKGESPGLPEERGLATVEESSQNLEKKPWKVSAQSHTRTLEEMSVEPSSPEEKFKRYMSK